MLTSLCSGWREPGKGSQACRAEDEGLAWSLQGTFCDNLEASHPSSLDFSWKQKRWEQMAFRASLIIYFISLKFDCVVTGGCNVILFFNHGITQMNKTLKKLAQGQLSKSVKRKGLGT